MAEIVAEVGPDNFLRAVRKAISLSRSRYDCTVLKIRECAGLAHTPEPAPAATAWSLATQVFLDHCRTDAEGNYRLEERITMTQGEAKVTPIPEIPPPILRAIQGLGGWGALADQANWSFRYRDFKELFHPETDPVFEARQGQLTRPSLKTLP